MMRRLVAQALARRSRPRCASTRPSRTSLEAALKACPGAALVNSINLENGRERIDAVLPLVVKYGAAVIALTIDEQGMAKTRRRASSRSRAASTTSSRGEYGLPRGAAGLRPAHLHAGHRRRGVPATRRSRRSRASAPSRPRCPACSPPSASRTSPSGFEARRARVLNSVFLYHAVQAGLDMAIVNPADITPYAGPRRGATGGWPRT